MGWNETRAHGGPLSSTRNPKPLRLINLAEFRSTTHNAPMSGVEPPSSHGFGASDLLGGPIQIPGFTLHRVIGVGAMGVVHEARQHAPPRTVAVKVMRLTAGAPQAERIRNEAVAVSRCNHPSIVQVHASGVLHGAGLEVPWIAMERVEDGKPIDAWFRERRPMLEQALRMFESLAEALHQAHLQGLLHRDLKPGNILVDAAGRPVVIDFGLAAIEGREQFTEPGTLVGTMRSMAPEVIAGQRADLRSDIFSLAVCMHECVAGAWPFGEAPTNLAALARAVETGARAYAHDRSRQIDGDLRWVLARALDPDPARRHQSMQAFADDLRAVRERRPVSARRPSGAYRLRCWGRRNPLALGLAGALVVALAVGAGFSLRLGMQAASEYDRANRYVEIYTAFMARQPVDRWPEGVTLRTLVDALTARHRHERSYRAPDREQSLRALTLSRAYLELGDPAQARAMLSDSREICFADPGSDASDRFETDLLDLMIRGSTDPEGAETRALAESLHARLSDVTPWRRRGVESVIMLHTGGPVTWACMRRCIESGDPGEAMMVAICLPHLSRFEEGSEERLLWASRRAADSLRRVTGPSVELVRTALRRGIAGLAEAGRGEVAEPLRSALERLENRGG